MCRLNDHVKYVFIVIENRVQHGIYSHYYSYFTLKLNVSSVPTRTAFTVNILLDVLVTRFRSQNISLVLPGLVLSGFS